MEIQYFKSAWGDIKNSPGWFGKLCLLALLNFIPVFGQIVTFAYLYGWAREIAWGVHEPMPRKLFANEDGKFWRRGWFVFVLVFVFAAVPQIVISLGDYWQGLGFVDTFFGGRAVDNPLLIGFGTLLSMAGWVAAVLCGVLAWIGAMRVAIYDRLSAGFQLGKIWKMLRHDTGGIVRIFGMELLFSLILGLLLSIVIFVLVFIVVAAGIAGLVNAGYSIDALQYMTNVQAARMLVQFVAAAGLVGVFAVLIGGFASALVVLFIDMLVIRAVGYWTMQFDVPNWDGQDDPMPFELDDEPEEYTWANEPPARPQTTRPATQAPAATPVAPAPAPSADSWRSGANGAASAPSPAPEAAAPIEVAPVVAAAPIPMPAVSEEVRPDADPVVPEAEEADAASGDDADELPAGVLPGFTYAGTGEADFPAAPAPAADPIADGESLDVSYGEPAVVGAEFLISPEQIEMLQEARDVRDAAEAADAADGEDER